jgi:hypothetical protein
VDDNGNEAISDVKTVTVEDSEDDSQRRFEQVSVTTPIFNEDKNVYGPGEDLKLVANLKNTGDRAEVEANWIIGGTTVKTKQITVGRDGTRESTKIPHKELINEVGAGSYEDVRLEIVAAEGRKEGIVLDSFSKRRTADLKIARQEPQGEGTITLNTPIFNENKNVYGPDEDILFKANISNQGNEQVRVTAKWKVSGASGEEKITEESGFIGPNQRKILSKSSKLEPGTYDRGSGKNVLLEVKVQGSTTTTRRLEKQRDKPLEVQEPIERSIDKLLLSGPVYEQSKNSVGPGEELTFNGEIENAYDGTKSFDAFWKVNGEEVARKNNIKIRYKQSKKVTETVTHQTLLNEVGDGTYSDVTLNVNVQGEGIRKEEGRELEIRPEKDPVRGGDDELKVRIPVFGERNTEPGEDLELIANVTDTNRQENSFTAIWRAKGEILAEKDFESSQGREKYTASVGYDTLEERLGTGTVREPIKLSIKRDRMIKASTNSRRDSFRVEPREQRREDRKDIQVNDPVFEIGDSRLEPRSSLDFIANIKNQEDDHQEITARWFLLDTGQEIAEETFTVDKGGFEKYRERVTYSDIRSRGIEPQTSDVAVKIFDSEGNFLDSKRNRRDEGLTVEERPRNPSRPPPKEPVQKPSAQCGIQVSSVRLSAPSTVKNGESVRPRVTITNNGDLQTTNVKITAGQRTIKHRSITVGEHQTRTVRTVFTPVSDTQITATVSTSDGPCGFKTIRKTEEVIVTEREQESKPSAGFYITDQDILTAEQFTAVSTSTDPDRDIVSETWRANGRVIGSGERVTTSFGTTGLQEISLTVEDSRGATSSETKTVDVKPEPGNCGIDRETIRLGLEETTVQRGEATQVSVTVNNAGDPQEVNVAVKTFRGKLLRQTTQTVTGTQTFSTFASPDSDTLITAEISTESQPCGFKTISLSEEVIVTGQRTNTDTEIGNGLSNLDAFFTYQPVQPEEGEIVTFTGQNGLNHRSGTTYNWDFDRGRDAQGRVVYRRFEDEGSYDVTLRATDSDGSTDSYTREIQVGNTFEDTCRVSVSGTSLSSDSAEQYGSVRASSSVSNLGAEEISVSASPIVNGRHLDSSTEILEPGETERFSRLLTVSQTSSIHYRITSSGDSCATQVDETETVSVTVDNQQEQTGSDSQQTENRFGLTASVTPQTLRSSDTVTVRGRTGPRETVEIRNLGTNQEFTVESNGGGFYTHRFSPSGTGTTSIQVTSGDLSLTRTVTVQPSSVVTSTSSPKFAFQGEEYEVCGQVRSPGRPLVELVRSGQVVDSKRSSGEVCFEQSSRTATEELQYKVEATSYGQTSSAETSVEIFETKPEITSFPGRIQSLTKEAGTARVTLYNNRDSKTGYEINAFSPEAETTVSDNKVVLMPGETKSIFVQVLGQEEGSFRTSVRISSQSGSVEETRDFVLETTQNNKFRNSQKTVWNRAVAMLPLINDI